MAIDERVTVFGGSGMLGGALVRRLQAQGFTNVDAPSRQEVDLLSKKSVSDYLRRRRPAKVYMAAGLVGGIRSNELRGADFLCQNALMALHVLDEAAKASPQPKVLYTGSTCIYPRENPQPIVEERLLTGPLEQTNIGYALAKIAGVVGGQLYRKQYGLRVVSVMPTNMYGPGDNYDLENGHMIASLIRKFVDGARENKPVMLWGSGKPRREALYSEDCADACIHLMEHYDGADIVNIGVGFDYSIREFADIIAKATGYKGKVSWDASKPDGTFEKRTSTKRLLSLMPHFKPRGFDEGLREVLRKDFGYTC